MPHQIPTLIQPSSSTPPHDQAANCHLAAKFGSFSSVAGAVVAWREDLHIRHPAIRRGGLGGDGAAGVVVLFAVVLVQGRRAEVADGAHGVEPWVLEAPRPFLHHLLNVGAGQSRYRQNTARRGDYSQSEQRTAQGTVSWTQEAKYGLDFTV